LNGFPLVDDFKTLCVEIASSGETSTSEPKCETLDLITENDLAVRRSSFACHEQFGDLAPLSIIVSSLVRLDRVLISIGFKEKEQGWILAALVNLKSKVSRFLARGDRVSSCGFDELLNVLDWNPDFYALDDDLVGFHSLYRLARGFTPPIRNLPLQ
jgi:hypothetical protein